MLQAFFSSVDGHWMEVTLTGVIPNYCRWAGHTEFIYTFLLPFFLIFQNAATLLILKTAAISAGGIAVYLIGKESFKNQSSALLCALIYWSFPFLANNLLYNGIYADHFMILPHLFAWYFLKKNNNIGFWICIILSTLCKEYVFVFNFILGIVLFKDYPKKSYVLFGLAFFQFFILTPVANHLAGRVIFRLNLESHALPIGGGRGASAIFEKLTQVLGNSVYWSRLLPVAILFAYPIWKYPKGLILILPVLAGITLSDVAPLFNNHHVSMLMAPLFITLVEGTALIKEKYRNRFLISAVLIPSIAILFLHPGSIISTHLRELVINPQYRNVFHYKYTHHDRILDSLLIQIPEKVPVSSHPGIRTKLVDRKDSYVVPFPWDAGNVDYYIFDFFESLNPDHDPFIRKKCGTLLASSHFSLIVNTDGIIIFKKNSQPLLPGHNTLKIIDTLEATQIDQKPLVIHSSKINKLDNYFSLETVFSINRPLPEGDALVSILTFQSGDTLRILHLPTYFSTELKNLKTGIYEEKFIFHSDAASLENVSHIINLYKENEYLPFIARSDFKVETLIPGSH